jgi:multicomponent Na+:H+ antiporter subunit E
MAFRSTSVAAPAPGASGAVHAPAGKDTPRRSADQPRPRPDLPANELHRGAGLSNIPAIPTLDQSITRMRRRHIGKRVVVTTLLLIGAWYVLSGRIGLLYLGTGVLVSLGLALNFKGWDDGTRFRPLRFLAYLPWLAVQIVKSNLRVARGVLSPRLDISPTFISRRPDVSGDRGLTTLGASTTLTPGTLTVDVSPHELFIHALDIRSAKDVEEGVIAERVARVFEEERP